ETRRNREPARERKPQALAKTRQEKQPQPRKPGPPSSSEGRQRLVSSCSGRAQKRNAEEGSGRSEGGVKAEGNGRRRCRREGGGFSRGSGGKEGEASCGERLSETTGEGGCERTGARRAPCTTAAGGNSSLTGKPGGQAGERASSREDRLRIPQQHVKTDTKNRQAYGKDSLEVLKSSHAR
ncbi:unnamed protein product, partial [Scytosiphon promiscuus]